MPPGAVLLFVDETILRLYPPLRAKWAMRGEQPQVRITGRNAKRVLYGVVNPRTGHRVLMRGMSMRQEQFQAFLRLLRRRYPGRPLWLVLDEAGNHTAARSLKLAATLEIELVWLPKQCSELNAMDHLWRALKQKISANRQYRTVDEQAEWAEQFILALTRQQTLRKAGVLSGHFWLDAFL
jgi:transposase